MKEACLSLACVAQQLQHRGEQLLRDHYHHPSHPYLPHHHYPNQCSGEQLIQPILLDDHHHHPYYHHNPPHHHYPPQYSGEQLLQPILPSLLLLLHR